MSSTKQLPNGDLGDCGCGPGPSEVEGLSGTSSYTPIRAGGYKPAQRRPAAPSWAPATSRPPPSPRKKKTRSKGKGPYCVISHKGNTVHCYVDESVAQRVARRFGERSKTRFTVKKRGSD